MANAIKVGVGGWTFEPWRGVFYPEGLVQKRELEYAASKLTSIEINGTYYSTFKPDSWRKWRDETPADFVFSVKASRYCTNRKILSEGGESFDKFLSQGLTELGDKLGPINWQFIISSAIHKVVAGIMKVAVLPDKFGYDQPSRTPRPPSLLPRSWDHVVEAEGAFDAR